MPPLLGHTRSRIGARHALLAAETLAPCPAAGFTGARVYPLVAPALGTAFLQLLLHFEAEEGTATFPESEHETFIYILTGACTVDAGPAQVKRLAAGGYLYIPARHACALSGPDQETRIVVFQRAYRELPDVPPPRMIVGRSGQVQAQPYLGDPDARIQAFLPEDNAFDLAVSLLTFQPGASLPSATEAASGQSYLLTQGQGIARVEDAWYPVKEGDALWVGAYAPFWFVATGKTAAILLSCREVNRLPLS